MAAWLLYSQIQVTEQMPLGLNIRYFFPFLWTMALLGAHAIYKTNAKHHREMNKVSNGKMSAEIQIYRG